MMKFKGYILKMGKEEYCLKDQLGEGGFSLIYTTNNPNIICKIQVISQSNIAQAYYNQKKALKQLHHKNIVKLIAVKEQKLGGNEYGFLLLENCNRGNAFNILEQEEGSLPQQTVLSIFMGVASAVQYMHEKGFCHRDVKLQNVLKNQKDIFKLCDFGSSTKQIIKSIDKENRAQIEQYIQKTTTPLYRSPQQLDLYSGYQIGTKVDVFAMGVLAFMLCFKKQPFETRLSAINNQFFLPDEHIYSQQLINLIQSCFTTNPTVRPSAGKVKEKVNHLLKRKKAHIDLNFDRQIEQTKDELDHVNEKSFKKTETANVGFLDKMKRIYSQMTTETEGWIVSFIEDSEEAPNLKFNRSIISKCWEKRYKVEKFYEILWKQSDGYKSKCLVTLKLLILLHNFLRKGPVEAMTYSKQYSPIKLCTKIYNHWKITEKPINSEDVKRNVFVVLLIRLYCLVIIGKVKFCYENSEIIQGNSSIVPYLLSKDEQTILKFPFIQGMMDFLQTCTEFHETVQKNSYLIDIQRTMILSIVDEEYCMISTLTFVFSAFKEAVNYVNQELDTQKLLNKIQQLENRYIMVYKKLMQLFKKTSKLASLFQHNQFQLNQKVLDHVRNIKIDFKKKREQFEIWRYLNYKDSIAGLKIPLTYEQVIKNPNFLKDLDASKNTIKSKQYIEVDQFKVKKNQIPISANKQEKQEKDEKNKERVSFKIDKKKMESNFDDFTFGINADKGDKKEERKQNLQQFNTMEFTHQNLNKDFLTADLQTKQKSDQFADFLSIVDAKFQKDKKKGSEVMKQNEHFNQSISQVSKQVHASINGGDIKKIQLINFFDDEEVQEKVEDKVQNNKPSEPELEAVANEKSKIISELKQIKILQETCKSESFIDLKGFIMEQVKKTAEQYLIDFSNLKIKKKIGFGHSSEVFKGQWRGREVAIKKIKDDMNSPNSEKQFKRQIMTSVKIRHHPQLVTLIGVAQHENFYYIINQYCRGATLFDILHESKIPLPWRTRISMAKQIAKGMLFLHTNQPPIIHRDLKSLNVLLVNKYSDKHPDSMQIKIADFGLSRDFASTYMTGVLGTYHWMAPEIFNNEPYSLKADVYSFGIVLWQIIARCPPYLQMKNPQALMKYVTLQNGRPELQKLSGDCPKDLKALMCRCWDREPKNRPNFEQILSSLTHIQFF